MSEVFSVRLDDGLANQIKKLEKPTEWLKEAIIQKAMNEILLVDTNDYLEKYIIDKDVDYWSIHAIEIISSDSYVLLSAKSNFEESNFKKTMSIRFENLNPEIIRAFFDDSIFLMQQFKDKNIGDYFEKWLKSTLMSSNHYNLLRQQRRNNLINLTSEEIDDINFLYSIIQLNPGGNFEENVFEKNFERRGKNFKGIKNFFIKLGLVSLGYHSSKRFGYSYWHFPEISLDIMKELYEKNKNDIHTRIHESLTKEDIIKLSKIVDFHQHYDLNYNVFYARYLEKLQDKIIEEFDTEIEDFVSRYIIILLPKQGASKTKKRPDTITYMINPLAIHAVNQRIAEFFIV